MPTSTQLRAQLDQLILERVLPQDKMPMHPSRIFNELTRGGKLAGYTYVDVDASLNRLHGANEIRWVAFNGWALGGRPA